MSPNKPSITAPGVTFRTASGENVIVNDFENGHISGADGGSNITFIGPVTARTFRSDRNDNIVVDGWNVDCNSLHRDPDLPPRGDQQRHRPQLGDPGQHRQQPDLDQRHAI